LHLRWERGGKREEAGRRMEEGKGKDPPKVHWICQLGGELAPSLLGGIDAPAPIPVLTGPDVG